MSVDLIITAVKKKIRIASGIIKLISENCNYGKLYLFEQISITLLSK